MTRRVAELRSSVIYAIALSTGWLKPGEKIYALKASRLWDDARTRDQADMLMAAGAYQEAMPLWEKFSHWRKIGDALLALGDVAGARASYERGENPPSEDYAAFRRGPDLDRLIALAIAREDWGDVLRLIRAGDPDPFGAKDVTFGGGVRAKGPLVKLCAHAAAATGDAQIAQDMRRFFGLDAAEVAVFLDHARSGAYEKDIAKLGKPPLLRVAPRPLAQVMTDGNTDRSAAVAAFLERLEPGFRDALRNVGRWLAGRGDDALAEVTFWLTRVGSYDVFKSCLFALQCEADLFADPGRRQVEFYSSHPWITRAAMGELLAALVATGGTPTPQVLFSCVLQLSASIMADIDRGTFDPDRTDPLAMVRGNPVWAEAVIAAWAEGGGLRALWDEVAAEASGQRWTDVRRMPAFTRLCDVISAELQAAWKRDMEAVRWRAEEFAFLSLKALLPDASVTRHAMPSWLAPQHLDMLVPDAMVAIEYQGEQHYRPVSFFGGEAGFVATVRRDDNKRRLCELAGIRLEYIRFDEDAAVRLDRIASLCRVEIAKRRT